MILGPEWLCPPRHRRVGGGGGLIPNIRIDVYGFRIPTFILTFMGFGFKGLGLNCLHDGKSFKNGTTYGRGARGVGLSPAL